ncbi:MAG: hypothetical protein COA69_03510 [Robiginitomaculum sp.]|nr:MAG: hypothetical protein COA69_03510 [Robiginitomaculum sp.]
MRAGSKFSLAIFGLYTLSPFTGLGALAQIISQTPGPEIIGPENLSMEMLGTPQQLRTDQGTMTAKPIALLIAGFDTDMNYVIKPDEIEAGIRAAFSFADTDKSGKLSLIELTDWRRAALGSDNALPGNIAFTPNFSQSISPSSFHDVLKRSIMRFDTDENGNIHRADLLTVEQRSRGRARGPQDEKRTQKGNRPPRGEGGKGGRGRRSN